MNFKEASDGMHGYCCRMINFSALCDLDILLFSRIFVVGITCSTWNTSSCIDLVNSVTLLYVLCCTPVILGERNVFPYVLYTLCMRSWTILSTLAENVYVPIRSVQPFRDSVKMLYVPIRSVYVPYTILNDFVQFC